jgi:hypothetical protein
VLEDPDGVTAREIFIGKMSRIFAYKRNNSGNAFRYSPLATEASAT